MDALALAATVGIPVLAVAAALALRRLGYTAPYRIVAPAGVVAGAAAGVGLGGPQETGLQLTVLAGLATGLGIVHYLDAPAGRWARVLRSRLLLGVPWGTLVSVALVLAVYLLLQDGLANPTSPLRIPFTSWSYYYPLGVVTAPFAHGSLGHVTGNLLGTVVLAPLAEYTWSHFPTRRGTSSFSSWRANPYVRAFVLFPLGVVLVGLGTSVFAWGAVIGFSGVVFAFAGFAVVRYPLATVVALTARGAVSTTYYALRDPVVVASAGPSYGPPWWVGIAVQGHLLGLLLGAVLGVVIVGRRRTLPSAGRLFVGVALLGFSLTLYALWWYRDPTTFVLYRGIGVLLVVVLAVGLAAAVRADATELFEGVSRRQVAIAVVILPLLTMALVAVPLNTATVQSTDTPDDAIEIRDYRVFYAENVTNERVGAIDVEVLNETTEVRASGVIVVSEDRHLWTEAIGAGELAFWGERRLRVGDVDWVATVTARRSGWRVAGGDAVYNVFLRPPDADYRNVFASENDTAEATIEGRNVTVHPANGTFSLVVTAANETRGVTSIPAPGNVTTAGGLTFSRTEDRLYAERNGTRVLVAVKETYE